MRFYADLTSCNSHAFLHSPFLFPFECRQQLFYAITFDRDRALMKLQVSLYLLILKIVSHIHKACYLKLETQLTSCATEFVS